MAVAPAITHFLVGASLLVLAISPFALRYDLNRDRALWLIPVGGIWGLVPDFHHVAPVYAAELYARHTSTRVNLFAYHHLLDTPFVRARSNGSIFAAISLFVVSLGVLTLVYELRERLPGVRSPLERLAVAVAGGMAAGGYGSLALLCVVAVFEGFGTVAGLVGSGQPLVGMAIVIGVGLVGGVSYAVGVEFALAERITVEPGIGGVGGLLAGVGAWIVGVVVGVPLWVGVGLGGSVGVPFVHWPSLVGLAVGGAVIGVVYALIRGAFDSASLDAVFVDGVPQMGTHR